MRIERCGSSLTAQILVILDVVVFSDVLLLTCLRRLKKKQKSAAVYYYCIHAAAADPTRIVDRIVGEEKTIPEYHIIFTV